MSQDDETGAVSVGVDLAVPGADRTVFHTYDPSKMAFSIDGVPFPSQSEILLRAMDAALTGIKKALTVYFEPLLAVWSVPVRVDFGWHGHRWGRRRLRRERRRRIAANRERRRAGARKGTEGP